MDQNTITSILFNTKPVEDDVPTPTYLAMDQGRYKFIITKMVSRTQTGSNANGPIYRYTTNITQVDVGPVVKGQWEDWVLERNYVFHDTGYVRLYKNKQKVAEYIGPNWPQDGQHSKEPYYQMGLYKWTFQPGNNPVPNVTFIDMFIDEVRFGNYNATLTSMSPESDNPAPNKPPIASAGSSQNLGNSVTSTTLSGTATDEDGTIQSRKWTQISGPNTATFSNDAINNPTVSNLIPGLYKFRFTVTDNLFATAYAEVDIKVNKLPVFTLVSSTEYFDRDSVRFTYQVSDPDGTVVSVLAEFKSGPTTPNISNPNAVTFDITDLIPGDYILRTSATDNSGETGYIDWEFKIREAKKLRINKLAKPIQKED